MKHIIIFITILIHLLHYGQCRDCYLTCDQVQITYDKQLCYTNCTQRIIIGATVGSFFALSLIVCFICMCRYRSTACMYLIRRRLKSKYNIVDPGLITIEKYRQQRDNFINALKKSEHINNFYFIYNKQKQKMNIIEQTFDLVQQQDYLNRFTFKGNDDFSTYFVEGYFLCKNGEPYVWFYKHYDPYDPAILKGLKEIIVFESTKYSIQTWSGTWQGDSPQKGQQVNGAWYLIMKIIGKNNRLQQVSIQSNAI